MRAELGHGRVQGRLADGVRRRDVDVELAYDLHVRHAGGERDDFLRGSLSDEGHEYVEEMYGSHDVGGKGVEKVLCQFGWGFAACMCILLVLVGCL